MAEDNDSKIGHLEDEAFKRKERLKSLKRKVVTEISNGTDAPPKEELPKPVFRSYKPIDEVLNDVSLPTALPEDVDKLVQDQIDAAKERVLLDELDVTTLAPRKPDWDLKRDIAKKLEILERRTQRAIAELIRERLKAADDLAGAVASVDPQLSAEVDD